MTITRNFKLYLNAGTASAPYINVNQYDEGEEWVFTLYNEDGSTYTPSTGAIIGIKSDGNAIMNSGSVVGGKVVITETEQMTAASGRAIYELLIDNATHGTANFIVNVERRPSDDAEFSDSDLSMLQEAIDAAEVINEILDEGGDPSEIIEENVNAWLDSHPEATTTVEDGAITAPKINQSLWDKLLVSEEASGAVASFDDGADDVPVSSLKVALEPIQTGSGDPSPSNVRPIIASNGKNLLQTSATTRTISGVTFTVNADGTVSLSGTSTDRANFSMPLSASLADGNYILSGCPSGGSSSTYYIQAFADSAGKGVDQGSGVEIIDPSTVTRLAITVRNANIDTTGIVFKPMIRRADIADATYQPYQGIMVDVKGKNLLKNTATSRTVSGVTFTVNDDGSITTANTATANITYTVAGANGGTALFYLEEGKTYTFSGANFQLNGTTAIGAMATPVTYTAQSGDYISFCWLYIRNGETFNRTWYPQCEVGSEATTYEPYTGNTYPYTLGREVYGGTVDLTTGVLTVTHGIVGLGTYNWSKATASGNDRFFTTNMQSMVEKPATNTTVANIVCSAFVKASADDGYIGRVRNSITIDVSGTVSCYPPNGQYADGASFKTAMNGIQFVYPLATPTTINLTPTQIKTLLGYNNISSTGTVDVIYHADTKLYIDKRIAELG